MPTEEDVARWTAAVEEIMSQHPDWTEEEANAGLVWAVTDAELKADIEELAQNQKDVELWASVIGTLQEQHPEWSEQECNDNLIALLKWVEDHPEGDTP